eukprot:s2176_g4.t1
MIQDVDLGAPADISSSYGHIASPRMQGCLGCSPLPTGAGGNTSHVTPRRPFAHANVRCLFSGCILKCKSGRTV